MNKLTSILIFVIILLLMVCVALFNRGGNSQLKTDKSLVKQDKANIFKLSVFDSSLTRQIRFLKDSVNFHKKQVTYWRNKYYSPIKVTKQDIAKVFEQDSSTITKEVIKGHDCDSLQRHQALEISSLSRESLKFDSLIKVKNATIKYSLQMDSLQNIIVKGLERKVISRTFGEIALGIVALLAIIFHI